MQNLMNKRRLTETCEDKQSALRSVLVKKLNEELKEINEVQSYMFYMHT